MTPGAARIGTCWVTARSKPRYPIDFLSLERVGPNREFRFDSGVAERLERPFPSFRRRLFRQRRDGLRVRRRRSLLMRTNVCTDPPAPSTLHSGRIRDDGGTTRATQLSIGIAAGERLRKRHVINGGHGRVTGGIGRRLIGVHVLVTIKEECNMQSRSLLTPMAVAGKPG